MGVAIGGTDGEAIWRHGRWPNCRYVDCPAANLNLAARSVRTGFLQHDQKKRDKNDACLSREHQHIPLIIDAPGCKPGKKTSPKQRLC